MEASVPGVYISYPFCAQKCTYCNFASGVFPRELEPRYLEALRARSRAYDLAVAARDRLPGRRHAQQHGSRGAARAARRSSRAAPGRKRPSKPRPAASRREKARAWSAAGINRV